MATIATDTAAPVIAGTRLRGGNAGSARGAALLVAEALGTAREIGAGSAAGGVLLLRGDSAFYTGAVARMDSTLAEGHLFIQYRPRRLLDSTIR